MAQQELAVNVYVGDVWYGPDYGNAAVPAKIAKLITNPDVWVVAGADAAVDEPAPDVVEGNVEDRTPAFVMPDTPADVDPVIAAAQIPAPDAEAPPA